MFQTKLAEKIETNILRSVTFSPRKKCRLRGNVEKYGRARQANEENTRVCWIQRIFNTCHVMLVNGNNGYAKAFQCYVVRTLPVLFIYRYVIFNPYVCSGCVHSFGSDSATTAIWLST